jgi:hypothetical protein
MRFQILITLLNASLVTQAFPSPGPLRKLITESEYILVAHVRNVTGLPDKVGNAGLSRAELLVNEVVQGVMKEQILYVTFDPRTVCSEPLDFQKYTDALLFLDSDKDGFGVHAITYKTSVLTVEDADVYKKRIREMQQVLKITDKGRQLTEITEWLVKCAEHPATRHESIYELSPESNFITYYHTESESLNFKLTPAQRLRLKTALLSTTDSRYADFGLADLVYAGNEKEIFDYLLKGLRKSTEKGLWYSEEYMRRLIRYKTSIRLQNFWQDYVEMKYENNKEKLESIVKSFIVEIEML